MARPGKKSHGENRIRSQLLPLSQWLPRQALGFIGSALGLVGTVSVYCDWVGEKVEFALLSQCGNTCNCLCRSVSEIHEHVAGTPVNQQTTTAALEADTLPPGLRGYSYRGGKYSENAMGDVVMAGEHVACHGRNSQFPCLYVEIPQCSFMLSAVNCRKQTSWLRLITSTFLPSVPVRGRSIAGHDLYFLLFSNSLSWFSVCKRVTLR